VLTACKHMARDYCIESSHLKIRGRNGCFSYIRQYGQLRLAREIFARNVQTRAARDAARP
jgi:hypothetical protein